MLARFLARVAHVGHTMASTISRRLAAATKPTGPGLLVDTLADLPRSKPQLIAENALLRQQLLILRRSVKRPDFRPADRALLALLASRVRFWRHALLIVQPETLLRWHRDAFRLLWRHKSRSTAVTPKPKIAGETIALIKEMAAAKPLWSAERIRGELLKLDIPVAKTTIQRYMRGVRPPRCSGQSWATFLRNHAEDIWAADFLPVTDLLFRPLYAFFLVELTTRRVVHLGVTRHPSELMNAVCERFLGSVRRECLDHLVILGERRLERVLREYVRYFNEDRPHQGIKQQRPGLVSQPRPAGAAGGVVQATPVLGGLHHAYHRVA